METYDDAPSHLRIVLDVHERLKTVRQCANLLTVNGMKPDAIVCTGISGIVFGTTLADRLQVPIVVVRKHKEECHSMRGVEGPDVKAGHPHISASRYLFVDDFMASGATFGWVINNMSNYYPSWRIMGIMLYLDGANNSTARQEAKEKGTLLMTPDEIVPLADY